MHLIVLILNIDLESLEILQTKPVVAAQKVKIICLAMQIIHIHLILYILSDYACYCMNSFDTKMDIYNRK